ncbi:MAG TPA: XdhC/CoxF family protein, partial [Firmicutes bacterium]|nr:XdhC/CoxF family protein [Bacillota bacterium]
YSVTVIDDRQEFANEEKFPTADRLEVGDIAACLKAVEINRRTYLVIVTRGHACDEEALHAVVNRQAAYIGMIGSQRKVDLVFRNLEEKGVSAAALKKVHAPIGLDIGGNTPMEIALSIAAQLQQVRYGKK